MRGHVCICRGEGIGSDSIRKTRAVWDGTFRTLRSQLRENPMKLQPFAASLREPLGGHRETALVASLSFCCRGSRGSGAAGGTRKIWRAISGKGSAMSVELGWI